MKQAMLDVLAFMKIGQPDMVAAGLTRSQFTDHESYLIRGMAEGLARWADALKDQGSTGSALGARLMLEELGETLQAMANGDVVEFADGLADLAYVVCWTAVAHGIPLGEVFEEVHRSNMAKFPVCSSCLGVGSAFGSELDCGSCNGLGRVVVRDAGGKTQKPPGWKPPNIQAVLDRAVSLSGRHGEAQTARYIEAYGHGVDPHRVVQQAVDVPETPVLPTDLGQLLQANTVKIPEGFGLDHASTTFATIYSDDPNWLHLGPVPGNVRINLATGEVMLPEGADATQAAKAFWDAVAALGNRMYPRKTETPSTLWPPSWQELANMPRAEKLKIIERVRQAARSNLLQPAEVESEPTAPPGPRPSVYSPNGWRLFTDGGGGDWTLVNSSPLLTVEDYTKWYSLFLIHPDGRVEAVSFEDLDDGRGTPYSGHAPNPSKVVQLAKAHGWALSERALECVIGRWTMEHLGYDPETDLRTTLGHRPATGS